MASPVAPQCFLFDGDEGAPLTVALAHGAGAPMDSPFMAFFAEGLASYGYRAARFQFPYMAARRTGGGKRPPDRPSMLIETWRDVIAELGAEVGPERLVIGGKSLGGRIASMVADAAGVRGFVCLGYPFHPPGKPVQEPHQDGRIAHLRQLATPALIVQGTRDPFGSPEEVGGYGLSPVIAVHWLEDGDHGFVPRKGSGRTPQQNLEEALQAIAGFLRTRCRPG
jgi:predicted alpha/beta-hydrolase family hydrolase